MRLHQLLFTAFLFIFSCQQASVKSENGAVTNETALVKKIRYERPQSTNVNIFNIPYRTLDTSKSITTFAFGSCNDQTQPQPLWKLIQNKNPQLMIMMGDNVYASKPETKPIINQYFKLNTNKDYLALRESTPFLATWDDHDYGQNDGGADNPEKLQAQRIFLNYWSYIKNIIPKDQGGIYHSRIVGDKKRRVQFIMLDTRFDRSPLVKNTMPDPPPAVVASGETPPPTPPPRPYKQSDDPKARLLSESQWRWLEDELKRPAELRIVVSSIQFLAEDHGFEKWANFPFEKKKFLDLIEKNKIKNLVFLSGDRHLASIAKLSLKKFDIYDITGSSLNKNSPAEVPEVDQLYTAPSFLKINYGLATIDWSKKQVEFKIIDAEDKTQLSQIIKF